MTLHVTFGMFFGRPNPSWEIRDVAQLKELPGAPGARPRSLRRSRQ